jgi:thiamine-monophosphate kinase
MSSEFELIARYFTRPSRTAALGVGDDCALVRQPDGLALAVTTDMLVESVHFFPDVDPESLGHKTLAVNLSDLAAMGAEPRWATLALSLPAIDEPWLAAFSRGLFALADREGVELIGGDTTRGPLTLCMTLMGLSPPGLALRRDGARPGDDIWLSGATGEAALAVAHRRGTSRLAPDDRAACARRLDWPQPRTALGKALRGVASSAIDVSDGLVQDLGHICERSRVAAQLAAADLPRAQAVLHQGEAGLAALLGGGDDYELLFTVPPEQRERVARIGQRCGLPLTRIGVIVPTSAAGQNGAVTVLGEDGGPMVLGSTGFDHFA